GISEGLARPLSAAQLPQKHYSSSASIGRGHPDLCGTENPARGGVDGLFVRCKSAALRTGRSGNLGGAARHLRDLSPGTSAQEGHLAELVDRRRRPSAKSLPCQSSNKLGAPAF